MRREQGRRHARGEEGRGQEGKERGAAAAAGGGRRRGWPEGQGGPKKKDLDYRVLVQI